MKTESILTIYNCDICSTQSASNNGIYPAGWQQTNITQLTLRDAPRKIDLCSICIASNDTLTLTKFKNFIVT